VPISADSMITARQIAESRAHAEGRRYGHVSNERHPAVTIGGSTVSA
jgi:hypothetical protein